jgi:2-aminoadipate transaminase
VDRETQVLARRAANLAAVLPASLHPSSIAFDSGHASPELLPDLTSEAERALTRFRSEVLQYAPRPGIPDLRAEIAAFMATDGIHTDADHVMVTNGAKHAIELVCRLLLDEGDSIVVTAPTYFTALPIFRSFGATFVEIGQDHEGLDVGELEDRFERLRRAGSRLPKFIYNVPDFHNPTGVTMSLARREALLDLSARHRIFILEDSPYRMIRFEGNTLPSLKELDRGDLVFHLGTFSKLMAPGLRVGWVTTTPALIARLAQLKSDGGSCPLTQRVIVEFLAGGRLPEHMDRVRSTYRIHRDSMIAAMRNELPEITFTLPEGGYYLWLTLPPELDGAELAARAEQAGVTVLPGSKFFADPRAAHPRNHLRLAYSHATPAEIGEGVRRLATTVGLLDVGSSAAGARVGA